MNPEPQKRPLVLMVDDTPANLELLSDLLTTHGFEVSVAEDGEGALQQVDYIRPALILLDVLMPNMDGFTACKRLKERPDTGEIPVIFMSALTDTIDKVRGFELGAVDYITKPFQQEEVLARITAHLAVHELKARLKESEERLLRIIESVMDAIIVLDREARILLFNRAAERVFRSPAEAAVGAECSKFLTPPLHRRLEEYMNAGLPQAPIWIPDGHRALRADGESFPVEVSISHAETNGRTLYTVVLRDVLERHQAEAERQRLQGINLYLQEELRVAHPGQQPVGSTRGLRAVMDRARQVAGTDASVLISGETGTGKEVIARSIHALSRRGDKVMVKLNCAAIPRDLVESELFGHEKGAFTGALARKLGRFELADHGTLFLDEVGELGLDVQAKLLRVLQEGELERVGGTETRRVDVRIIAATNRDLGQCVKQGTFRADLYYRLNVFPIGLPPLRSRKDDLPLLTEHLVRKYAQKYGKHIEGVPAEVMAALRAHDWPGNVRELEHVLERAVITSRGTELALDEDCLQPGPRPGSSPVQTLDEAERIHILKALESTGWRVSGPQGAAEILGLKPTTLESRMKKLGITRPS